MTTTAPSRHLFLIGLMGAGKTTVGRALAAQLDRTFVDTDDVVVERAGATIEDIFAAGGERRFRALEQEALAATCRSPEPLVIACGGGAVVNPRNRELVRECGVVVWLRAPVGVLAARVGHDRGRPLLADDPLGALTRLEDERAAAYSQAAHVAVDTTGRDIPEVVAAVLDAVAAGAS